MEDVWFTSDTHFFHSNILWLGKGRPFASTEEMNEEIIKRWNERVRKQDRIYHLGDISFGNLGLTQPLMARLKGQIHIIRGNHDNEAMLKRLLQDQKNILSVKQYAEINFAGKKLVLFHFPILDWNRRYRGAWHLHGHTHGNLEFKNGPMLDVGVDCHDFAPVNFDQVETLLQDAPLTPHAHHAEGGTDVNAGQNDLQHRQDDRAGTPQTQTR